MDTWNQLFLLQSPWTSNKDFALSLSQKTFPFCPWSQKEMGLSPAETGMTPDSCYLWLHLVIYELRLGIGLQIHELAVDLMLVIGFANTTGIVGRSCDISVRLVNYGVL